MAEYSFDPVAARERLVKKIREFTQAAGVSRVVLGISGGKDSTVAAALCARALGAANVFGIMMPDGVQKDISDSMRVCRSVGINHRIVNISEMHTSLLKAVEAGSNGEIADFPVAFSEESNVNVPPRLRMTTLRYVAQAIGAFLCGTGNLSEATVGYCTKDGDTSCDFNPLGTLTSVEVVQVGLTMDELPRELVQKTPDDGLSGVPDEVKLGITYRQIHDFLRLGSCGDPEMDEKIARREKANMHKRRLPTILDAWKD
ncbi:MAG: NAD(+) synthase [Clostridia bacterium]|nr:NAD(+) synthase [Clostridia bacterium]